MKVIYIAGAYRDARGEWFVQENIRKAEEAALAVWKAGAVALCPHKNTAMFGGACPDETWLKGDLELLSRCDAVWAIDGHKRSEGATKEIQFAFENSIYVLWTWEQVVAFIDDRLKEYFEEWSKKESNL